MRTEKTSIKQDKEFQKAMISIFDYHPFGVEDNFGRWLKYMNDILFDRLYTSLKIGEEMTEEKINRLLRVYHLICAMEGVIINLEGVDTEEILSFENLLVIEALDRKGLVKLSLGTFYLSDKESQMSITPTKLGKEMHRVGFGCGTA